MTVTEIAALMRAHGFDSFTLLWKDKEQEWWGGLRNGHAVACGAGATAEKAAEDVVRVAMTPLPVLPADTDLFA